MRRIVLAMMLLVGISLSAEATSLHVTFLPVTILLQYGQDGQQDGQRTHGVEFDWDTSDNTLSNIVFADPGIWQTTPNFAAYFTPEGQLWFVGWWEAGLFYHAHNSDAHNGIVGPPIDPVAGVYVGDAWGYDDFNGGYFFTHDVVVEAVPEADSAMLLMVGMLGVMGARRSSLLKFR